MSSALVLASRAEDSARDSNEQARSMNFPNLALDHHHRHHHPNRHQHHHARRVR